MAYNGRYSGNPDALPAHAEPEQAAALLSSRPPNIAHNPVQTAPGQNMRNDDRYSRPPPPPAAYQSLGPQQNYYDGRQQPPPALPQRYDNYAAPPSHIDRFGNAPPQQGQRFNTSQSGAPLPPPARNPYASPQPQAQGPPPSGYHNRPPIPAAQRPPNVAPQQANDRDALWPLFRAVDADRTGQLSENSLRRALVNGDYTAFDPHTVRMMIRMFDADRSGTIDFDEFCGLWGFLAAWRGLFDRFDLDRSGNINFTEFSDALVAFGYRLSPQFVQLLFNTYAKNVGSRGGEKGLSFDLFVQACISLKRMTDVFKRFDTDRDGYITLSFEEFLTGGQSLFLFNSISAVTDTGLY